MRHIIKLRKYGNQLATLVLISITALCLLWPTSYRSTKAAISPIAKATTLSSVQSNVCPQIIEDKRPLDASFSLSISDFTEHSYNAPAGQIGSFADCTITRRFSHPIRLIRVTIVQGHPDDIGFIGNMQVTSTGDCSGIGVVQSPVDVTSQVTIGNRPARPATLATLVLRAKENCCCATGWGNAPGRNPAMLRWAVRLRKYTGKEKKTLLARYSAESNLSAAGMATVASGAALIPDPTISKLAGGGIAVVSGLEWTSSALTALISLDPPDPNFTVIAQPVIPAVPLLAADSDVPQEVADAFNALIINQAQTIGYLRALLTSIEREQGAAIAGNTFWEMKQQQAASMYERTLATLFDAQPALRTNIVNVLESAGIPTIAASLSDASTFQQNVMQNGLPDFLVQPLVQAGVDSAVIDAFRQFIIEQPPSALAGNFQDKLTEPELISSIQDLAAGLSVAGTDLSVNISASPEPVLAGSNITYTMTVTNNGEDDAESVMVTDNLPANTTFVSCSAANGICGGSGNNRRVTFPSLAVGASKIITLVAKVKCSVADGTSIRNAATVNSSTSDFNTGNNTARATSTAANPPPTITAPAPTSTPTNANCQAMVPNVLPQVRAFDNCGPVRLKQNPAAGTLVGVGPHLITVTATDPSGSTSSVTTTFTVVAVPSLVVSVNPVTVRQGSRATLNAAFSNCASSRQVLTLKVSSTPPLSNILMATLPVTLQAGQRGSLSIPLIIPKSTPTGLYTLALDVYVGGVKTGTSTVQLLVIPSLALPHPQPARSAWAIQPQGKDGASFKVVNYLTTFSPTTKGTPRAHGCASSIFLNSATKSRAARAGTSLPVRFACQKTRAAYLPSKLKIKSASSIRATLCSLSNEDSSLTMASRMLRSEVNTKNL